MKSKVELRDWWKNNYIKDEALRKARIRSILDLLLHSEIFLDAPTVGIYSALASEVDLKSLWSKRPQACVFPKVLPLNLEMEFYRIGDWSDLKLGYGGILEPQVSPGFRIQDWKPGSLLLIPGVAFNHEGVRIGTGKGYYDRFLSKIPETVTRWGVCYKEQFFVEEFQVEPTDVRMHAVITDEGFNPVVT